MVQINTPCQVIDTHVHFWDPERVSVPWLSGAPHFNERRDGEKYSKEIPKGVQVQGAVYVETDVDPRQGLVEADWIAQYAERLNKTSTAAFGGIAGIVAYAPVDQGQPVRHYLRLLTQLVPSQRLRGVRYLIQDPSLDPERVAQPSFVEGVKALGEYNLSFDLNINCNESPAQFPPLIQLVRQCPEITFVLDHMAKPPCDSHPGEPAFTFWQDNMMALAQFPNVSCKVSGLVTETSTPTAKQLAPFVEVARKAFGIDRLMFGGDWPVCENGTRWSKWLEILAEIVHDWSSQDKEKLFVTNAIRIYRL